MTVPGTPSASGPVHLGPAEVAAALQRCGIPVGAVSPLQGLGLREASASSQLDENMLGNALSRPSVRRALRVLAEPRRLVTMMLRAPGQAAQFLLFLHDGEAIARFDISASEGVLVSSAVTVDDFAADLATRLALPPEARHPQRRVSRRLLLALERLLATTDAGNRSSWSAPKAEVLETLQRCLPDGVAAETALAALEADGLLQCEGGRVRLAEEWAGEFSYLLDDSRIEIYAVPLAMGDSQAESSRCLTILGRRSEALTVSTPGRRDHELDELVLLEYAARSTLRAALRSLLQAWRPPLTPRPGRSVRLSPWVATSSRSREATEPRSTLRDCIVDPAATVQLVSRHRGQPGAESSVIALVEDRAAEWRIVNDEVVCAELDPDGLQARLCDFFPDDVESGSATVHLTSAQVNELISGSQPGETEPPVPAPLVELRDAPDLSLKCVRVLVSQPGGLRGVELLFASAPGSGTWRLDHNRDGFLAAGCSGKSLRAEVAAALSG